MNGWMFTQFQDKETNIRMPEAMFLTSSRLAQFGEVNFVALPFHPSIFYNDLPCFEPRGSGDNCR